MSHPQIVAATFVIVCAMSAFLGWLCGYNFDERNPFVAVWVGSTIAFALVITVYVADLLASVALNRAEGKS